jgi:hypothetical protein
MRAILINFMALSINFRLNSARAMGATHIGDNNRLA